MTDRQVSVGLGRRIMRAVASLIRPLVRATLPLVAKAVSLLGLGGEAVPVFSSHGFYLLPKHYYGPVPEEQDCTDEYWESTSEMVGIHIDVERITRFVQDELAPFNNEFRDYPLRPRNGAAEYHLLNGRFMAVDGNVYYSLIRRIKPSRILEVGCGYSTMLASDAIRKNLQEGSEGRLICVEPYPMAGLKTGSLEIAELIESKVQQVPLGIFTALETDNILFIDTTHVLKAGGDVEFLYCEVLPRLRPGVLVHVHDVSLPRRYPRIYLEESHYYWNEQYMLQAFLTHNSRTEVVWPGNFMMIDQPAWMLEQFPEIEAMRRAFPYSEPTSFWFRIT